MSKINQDPLHQWLAALRAGENLSPGTIDALSRLAKDVASSGAPIENWESLIDFLANQALRGVDISKSYPAAFQLLLADSKAHALFADLLEAVEADEGSIQVEYPEMKQMHLSALIEAATNKDTKEPSLWEGMFRRSAQELSNLFLKPSAVLREPTYPLAEKWASVLREDVNMGTARVVALNLEILAANPKQAELALSLASHSTEQGQANLIYKVRITWGHYVYEMETEEVYRKELPLAGIQELMAGTQVVQDLAITVQARPS